MNFLSKRQINKFKVYITLGDIEHVFKEKKKKGNIFLVQKGGRIRSYCLT